MEYKELGIGNKINLLRVKNALGEKTAPKQYISQLLDIDVVTKIAKIAMPIEKKIIVPLEIGDIYNMVIYTSNGLFQCMIKIERRYKENSLYVLDVQFMSKLEKYQRRQYYRLMCNMVVKHRSQKEREVELQDKLLDNRFLTNEDKQDCINELNAMAFEWNEGQVVDLSGGGIRFISPVKYEKESVIVLKIEGTGLKEDNCVVNLRVIQCEKKDYNTGYTYDIRGEFVDINNVMRENLVRYIFEEQRRRIKK